MEILSESSIGDILTTDTNLADELNFCFIVPTPVVVAILWRLEARVYKLSSYEVIEPCMKLSLSKHAH